MTHPFKLPPALVGAVDALSLLFMRVVVAHPFFLSGQTKVDGPQIGGTLLGLDLTATLPTSIKDATFTLFAEEYKAPLVSPELAAYAATAAENLLPILLVLGLTTRLSALGLLVLTLVIQLFVYPDAWWTVHAYWAALLLALVVRGAGALSLDRFAFGVRRRALSPAPNA
jgi:putative oxidoreductase